MCKKIEISEVEYKELKLVEQEYKLIVAQMEILRKQNKKLVSENNQLKTNTTVVKKHNERNAGRKNKFSDEIIKYVVELRSYGWEYSYIKDRVFKKFNQNISLGTISNIVKNN